MSNANTIKELKNISSSLLIKNNINLLKEIPIKSKNIESKKKIHKMEIIKEYKNDEITDNRNNNNTSKDLFYTYIYHICTKDYMPNCFEKMCSLLSNKISNHVDYNEESENLQIKYSNYNDCLKSSSKIDKNKKIIEEKLELLDENYKNLLTFKNKSLIYQNSKSNSVENHLNFLELSKLKSDKESSTSKIFSKMNKYSRINFLKAKIASLKDEVLTKEKELLNLMK